MPSPTYQQNKIHIYKWRMNNPEHNRELNRLSQKRYTAWKKIKMEFLSILLEN